MHSQQRKLDIDDSDSTEAKSRPTMTLISAPKKKRGDESQPEAFLMKCSEGRFFTKILREIRTNGKPENAGVDVKYGWKLTKRIHSARQFRTFKARQQLQPRTHVHSRKKGVGLSRQQKWSGGRDKRGYPYVSNLNVEVTTFCSRLLALWAHWRSTLCYKCGKPGHKARRKNSVFLGRIAICIK